MNTLPSDSARRPWYSHFRVALNQCQTLDEIETLLRGKVVRWRGKASVKYVGGWEKEDAGVKSEHPEDEDFDLSLIT